MNAVAEHSAGIVGTDNGRPSVRPAGTVARRLADAYLRALSTDLRGEPGWVGFERWLWAFWCPELPPAPARPPDAVSHHGAGGRGVHWYETPTAVVGHVPGSCGGYRVPIGSVRSECGEDESLLDAGDRLVRGDEDVPTIEDGFGVA